MRIDRAAVIGTGMMGPGIGAILALGGVRSTIVSRTAEGAERGLAAALAALRQLEDNGLIPPGRAAEAGRLLSASPDLAGAAGPADLVIESAPEDLALKQGLFARLEGLVPPGAILASNTSGLSITAIASACRQPERVVTTHFWNPPHLVPLVEIVRGDSTAEEVALTMRDLLARCGKVPVLVKKDRPGQLGNRLQMAMLREAAHIVQEGIADAEAVDLAVRLGIGIRLPVYGLLEHMDLVGLEMAHAVCDYTARDLNSEPRAPQIIRDKIARGETGARAGRGFHDWSGKDLAEVRRRRDQFVIDCLRAGVAGQGYNP